MMTDTSLRVLAVIIHVACIVTGEVRVIPEAALPVAQVAYNRLEAGMGYDGWHAIADEPESWALEASWQAYWKCGDKDGNLYALSETDMETLGFDEANWRNVGNDEWPVWVGRSWR